ncbi:NACHT domain-containing protein [Actinophytocola oryzae]|nr:NACHT domain-containing protein [Actinophytocola oryzae]
MRGYTVLRQPSTARRWTFLLLIGAIVAVLLWVVLALFGGGTNTASQVAGIVSVVYAAVALVFQLLGSSTATLPDLTVGDAQLDAAFRLLALRSQELSQQEERHWRIGDPRPLRMSWRGRGHQPAAGIHATYRGIPSGRLVITGRAGAGKTVLAHRLILECLDHPDDTARVPVLFSMSNWNPHLTGLTEMLADRLIRDHTFLDGVDAAGTTFARRLLLTGRILPILDGFDEIQPRHHIEAIREINRFAGPLVLTTRPPDYIAAVDATGAMGNAAVIELADIALDEAQRYLQAGNSTTRAVRWGSIFAYLRAVPGDPASRNLAWALRTPLLVMLVRTIYNDVPHQNPEDLLDIRRFPSFDAIEDHLFSAYLAALYDPRRTLQKRPVWTDHQARRWLGFLAGHLARRNTYDLAWWQLDTTLGRPARVLVTGIVTAPLGAAIGILGYLTADWLAGSSGSNQVSEGMLETGTGLAAGLTVGVINELRADRVPERLRFGRSRPSAPSRAFRGFGAEGVTGLVTGVVFSLASWLVYGVAYDFSRPFAGEFVGALAPALADRLPDAGVAVHVTAGLVLGVVVGTTYAIANVIVSLFSGPDNQDAAVSTWELLARDRSATLFRVAMVGAMVVLVNAIAVGNLYVLESPVRQGVLYGFLYGLVALLTRLLFSSWGGRWLVFARLWLPLTGRLPWRPKRFLDDAHRRGVLRESGAVYQFRHARLRDHLVSRH